MRSMIDAARIQNRIERLAAIGGAAGEGVNRLAFSAADVEGRAYAATLMRQAGLTVSTDAAANLLGRREGNDAALPPIMFGSHLDTVPNGGRFDGALGVLAALEVIEALNARGVTTRHPLELVSFTDEEGGLTGSRAMAGVLSSAALDEPSLAGCSVREGLGRVGGEPDRIAEAARRRGQVAAFLELHVEQGSELLRRGARIGVVTGFVGIRRWEVVVTGKANHAGTTAMSARRDALTAAARLILAAEELARCSDEGAVATIGVLRAYPGAPNVIPGRVEMVLEIRAAEERAIEGVWRAVRERAAEIARGSETSIDFGAAASPAEPISTHPRLRDLIRAAATELDLRMVDLPSGAGHDAQNMARIAPTGMIFVPSAGGISHSPDEFTAPEDVAAGTAVLLGSILRVDRTGV